MNRSKALRYPSLVHTIYTELTTNTVKEREKDINQSLLLLHSWHSHSSLEIVLTDKASRTKNSIVCYCCCISWWNVSKIIFLLQKIDVNFNNNNSIHLFGARACIEFLFLCVKNVFVYTWIIMIFVVSIF